MYSPFNLVMSKLEEQAKKHGDNHRIVWREPETNAESITFCLKIDREDSPSLRCDGSINLKKGIDMDENSAAQIVDELVNSAK